MGTGSVQRRQRVRELVHEFVRSNGRVLEVSCGNAELLRMLRESGFEVRGTNFSEYPASEQSIPIDQGIDLVKGFPYDDQSYDCVILLDVIEHVRDALSVLQHIARVFKVGGCLILVTPNIMRIGSRIEFLLTGIFRIKRAFIGFDLPLDRAFAFHNHPAHLPVLLYQMQAMGMACTLVVEVSYKAESSLFWLLLGSWITLATWIKANGTQRHLKETNAASLLFHSLFSFKSLNGESIIVVSQKRHGVARDDQVKTELPTWSKPIQVAS